MYYYRRKTSPLKWFIIIVIIALIGVGVYWFYENYFSKIDFSRLDTEEEIITEEPDDIFKTIATRIFHVEGSASIDKNNQGYQDAAKDIIIESGDKVKTDNNSRLIIVFENGSVLRLGSETEIVFEQLNDKNVLIKQISGRSYHKLSNNESYQVESLNVLVSTDDANFEVITNNEQSFIAVLTMSDEVNVEVNDEQGLLVASRLEAAEKALIETKANKNDILTVENFTEDQLLVEDWYQWNFDLDENGLIVEDTKEEDEEPDFSITDESLELSAESKDTGIFLSWSIFNGEDFASYQIVRSESNSEPKYPDNDVIKSSTSKGLNSYLDTGNKSETKYYYRVCIVKMNDKVVCGNIRSAVTEKEDEEEEEEEEEEDQENDTTPPASPSLSISVSVDGVNLNWSENQDEDFKEYKVLRSQTNMLPSYPNEQISIRLKASNYYLDNMVNITSVGMYYYRVCAVDQSANYSCSNVRIIENGQVK